MEWRGRRESDNIEDRRGSGGIKTAGMFGGGGIILALLYVFLGGDPRVVLDQLNQGQSTSTQTAPDSSGQDPNTTAGQGGGQRTAAAGDDDKAFIGVVLADTEDVWTNVFAKLGKTYTKPKLVLFSGRAESACGLASSAVGPFYCPRDHQVYLDLDFYHELSARLGAKGEFAKAYVLAHEVGHHVQNLLGSIQEGPIDRQRSVQVELQADCYAGVWAKQTDQSKHVLEQGDIESALSAAEAVGDDRLQKAAGHAVAPDTFTHGSSAQRMAAFKRGFGGGNQQDCGGPAVAH